MSRVVRVTEEFWVSLDLALPAEHDPSWHAFAAYDLPAAINLFAEGWSTLAPLVPGRGEYRLLVAAGRTVYAYSIEGQLALDGAVELIHISVDTTGPGLPATD